MQINTKKTKETFISSTLKDPPPSVTLSGETVERVATLKLLGVHVSKGLKWAQHIQAFRNVLALELMTCCASIAQSVIRPVLKYAACPVWHSS